MAFLVGVKQRGLPVPEREYRFHPTRKWRVDFVWVEQRLAVEIEGGIWRRGGGAHSHPLNIERDIEKSNALTLAGFHLLRITDKAIKSGVAFAMVAEFLSNSPQPVVVPANRAQAVVAYHDGTGNLLPCVSVTA